LTESDSGLQSGRVAVMPVEDIQGLAEKEHSILDRGKADGRGLFPSAFSETIH